MSVKTFGNQLALFTHCPRGSEVVLSDDSHIVQHEAGASAIIAGVLISSVSWLFLTVGSTTPYVVAALIVLAIGEVVQAQAGAGRRIPRSPGHDLLRPLRRVPGGCGRGRPAASARSAR